MGRTAPMVDVGQGLGQEIRLGLELGLERIGVVGRQKRVVVGVGVVGSTVVVLEAKCIVVGAF
jgi:hypothetical protein